MLSEVNAIDRDPAQTNSSTGPRGMLLIVCSPSGGGKGTLIRRVRETVPGLGYSVSWTTREPRAGEQDGVNYHFVSVETFEQMRARGEFLEWACVHNNFYATGRSEVEREMAEGRDVILEIDVQGAAAVRRLVENTVSVFILPPSFEVLRARLLARESEDPEALALRLRNARGEVERYTEFDYVVLNDTADQAAAQLASIVYAERARRERQHWLARRVLATFPETPGGD
jgi:guanylate kinase